MNKLLSYSPLRFNEIALVIAIIVTALITNAADSNHSYFRDPLTSAKEVARYTAVLGIFALGATVVIISGGIDLSVGSMIAFGSTACCTTMLILAPKELIAYQPVGATTIAIALGATMLAGLLVGTLHAWLITAVRLPPFVATLATLVGLRSLSRALCENVTTQVTGAKSVQITVYDPFFRAINNNVWYSVVTFAVLAIITWIILSYTVLGRHLYALGGNEQAAKLSGIRTERIKWFAYCYGSVTASIASLFFIAYQAGADPVLQGLGSELNAIAAAVVGGCSLQGGVGTIMGTVLGALFLRVVIDAVSKVIKTGADVYEGMIVGVVVVLAVTLSQIRQLMVSGREIFPGAMGIAAIPTLSLLALALGVMIIGTVPGSIIGGTTLVLLIAIKVFEVLRSKKA